MSRRIIGFDRATLLRCCAALASANRSARTPEFAALSPDIQRHVKRIVAAMVPILVRAIEHPADDLVMTVEIEE